MERWLNQNVVYDGAVFAVISGDVVIGDGTTAKRDVVHHKGSVAIVPVMGDKVILVRQFRIAAGKAVLEIPAGRIDEGEQPIQAAARELEEETGYRAARVEQGPTYYSSVGFLDERIHVFFAFDLQKVDEPRKGDEIVQLELISLDDIERRLNTYQFDDSKTIIGVRELLIHLKK